ncbi:hypothetical protein OIU74_009439 [Salix koriyanagi]|uniref:Uncharacterized protein n=1 Tax=Salix koriyanagi TaxID=2511006 RepID=A0A9Q0Z0N3_9ROSI|nr:hypothetical protein OIU74_009439 [Salix koriyanagi]
MWLRKLALVLRSLMRRTWMPGCLVSCWFIPPFLPLYWFGSLDCICWLRKRRRRKPEKAKN